MSMRAYLLSQEGALRALVDEHGADTVILAVVEYRKLAVGVHAESEAVALFGRSAVADLQREYEKLERRLKAAERDQDDAELDAKVQRNRVLELEALLDAARAQVPA